jgi:hypothetical protein
MCRARGNGRQLEIVMTNLDKHVGTLEKRLRHWGAKLDELTASAEGVNAEMRLDYLKRVADFRAMHQAAKSKLAECQAAGSEKWDDFKSGIETSWAGLESAFKELRHPTKQWSGRKTTSAGSLKPTVAATGSLLPFNATIVIDQAVSNTDVAS